MVALDEPSVVVTLEGIVTMVVLVGMVCRGLIWSKGAAYADIKNAVVKKTSRARRDDCIVNRFVVFVKKS